MSKKVVYGPSMAAEMRRLWNTMEFRASRKPIAVKQAGAIARLKDRYRAAGDPLGIPWVWIGCVHQLEAGLTFTTHLHNGDPLTGRTVHVPAGRPTATPAGGSLSYSWEESARDALTQKGLQGFKAWDIPTMLYQWERYNGFGYRLYHEMQTPYVWAGSNQYTKGKYVADGKWDSEHVSKQIGTAVLLRCLIDAGEWAAPTTV